jgi:hypothetical protein
MRMPSLRQVPERLASGIAFFARSGYLRTLLEPQAAVRNAHAELANMDCPWCGVRAERIRLGAVRGGSKPGPGTSPNRYSNGTSSTEFGRCDSR